VKRSEPFAVGKLPFDELQHRLSQIRMEDERLVVGPKAGEDAAVIDFGQRYLVAKTDPITFAAERIGWYAVHINANDIAVMGAEPRWFLATLLLPEATANAILVETIFEDLLAACGELGITLVGGHTEITHGLDHPIVVGHMLGEVERGKLVAKDQIEIGDWVLLTKGVAIEGTAMLAREKENELKEKCDAALLERAKGYLFNPGISIVREALTACRVAHIHAMHDPTEGGLIGGLCELAAAGGVGLLIVGERITVLPETKILCQALGLDPLRLIASGALLIVSRPTEAEKVIQELSQRGTEVSVIGEVTEPSCGIKIQMGDTLSDLVYPERDEIARVFSLEKKKPEGNFLAREA